MDQGHLNPQQFPSMVSPSWFHASESEKMPNRKRAKDGVTGGGLHLGTRDAGRHVRYESSIAYETVAGNTIYLRMGRPYVHVFGVREGQQFARSGDLGVRWPYKGPDRPTLYRNDVEDAGKDSLWAKPSEHLEYRGVRPNLDTHVTDLPESTVYAQAGPKRRPRVVEQLKLPGIAQGKRTWWEREDE
jgi:hypothetical protein